MIRFRSSPLSIPDAIKLRLFLNAHHKGSLPMQLKVVWNQLLQADPEGPTLIFCAALHFEQLYTTQPRIRGTLTACKYKPQDLQTAIFSARINCQ